MKQALQFLLMLSVLATISLSAPSRPNCAGHRANGVTGNFGWLKGVGSNGGRVPIPRPPSSPPKLDPASAPAKPPVPPAPATKAAPEPAKIPVQPLPATPPKPIISRPPPQPTRKPVAPLPPKMNSITQAYLDSHNKARAAHAAAPLAWSDNLARAAQVWANRCVLKHSGGSLGPYGENLAWGPPGFNSTDAVNLWTAEKCTPYCCPLNNF